jgi:hypothetical protein
LQWQILPVTAHPALFINKAAATIGLHLVRHGKVRRVRIRQAHSKVSQQVPALTVESRMAEGLDLKAM